MLLVFFLKNLLHKIKTLTLCVDADILENIFIKVFVSMYSQS